MNYQGDPNISTSNNLTDYFSRLTGFQLEISASSNEDKPAPLPVVWKDLYSEANASAIDFVITVRFLFNTPLGLYTILRATSLPIS